MATGCPPSRYAASLSGIKDCVSWCDVNGRHPEKLLPMVQHLRAQQRGCADVAWGIYVGGFCRMPMAAASTSAFCGTSRKCSGLLQHLYLTGPGIETVCNSSMHVLDQVSLSVSWRGQCQRFSRQYCWLCWALTWCCPTEQTTEEIQVAQQ